MANSRKKKILIIASLLIIAGVGGYFIYRKIRSKKEEEERKKAEEQALLDSQSNKPSGGGSGGGGYSGSTSYTFPFVTTEEGNKFRAWVNEKYPAYAKEISLDKTGGLNAYLEKAWVKYGALYLASNISAGIAGGTSASGTSTKNRFIRKGLDSVMVYNTPKTEDKYALGKIFRDSFKAEVPIGTFVKDAENGFSKIYVVSYLAKNSFTGKYTEPRFVWGDVYILATDLVNKYEI